MRSLPTSPPSRRNRIASFPPAVRGYEITTIRDIAVQAETTPATIYRYFTSKDNLLRHVMIEWASRTALDLRAAHYRGGSHR